MARDKVTHERRHIRDRIDVLNELLSGPVKRTYNELLEDLSNILESKGEVPVRMRTLKSDISHLEYTLGAPIHRPNKKDNRIYYTEKFSTKSIPLDEEDISILKTAIHILKKATNINIIKEVEEIITKLENKIHTNVPESNTMIAFEEHTEALGKEYLNELFTAIQCKSPVKIQYKPFGKEIREWTLHPYMLKASRSRWFLIGRVDENKYLSNIRLDSIVGKIRNSPVDFIENNLFDPETYFNNVIGVTIPRDQQPVEITIKVKSEIAGYVRTKPIHKSQKINKAYKDGSLILNILVYNNYELKSLLLSYGPGIEIIKPAELRQEIKDLIESTLTIYK